MPIIATRIQIPSRFSEGLQLGTARALTTERGSDCMEKSLCVGKTKDQRHDLITAFESAT